MPMTPRPTPQPPPRKGNNGSPCRHPATRGVTSRPGIGKSVPARTTTGKKQGVSGKKRSPGGKKFERLPDATPRGVKFSNRVHPSTCRGTDWMPPGRRGTRRGTDRTSAGQGRTHRTLLEDKYSKTKNKFSKGGHDNGIANITTSFTHLEVGRSCEQVRGVPRCGVRPRAEGDERK